MFSDYDRIVMPLNSKQYDLTTQMTSVTTPASLDGGLKMPHSLLRSYWKLMASETGRAPSPWEGRWLLVGCFTLVDDPTDIGI